jgi:DNA-binding response OmpR family regulator
MSLDWHISKTLTHNASWLEILADRAYLHGADLRLTQKEFALLLLLAQNAGRTHRNISIPLHINVISAVLKPMQYML